LFFLEMEFSNQFVLTDVCWHTALLHIRRKSGHFFIDWTTLLLCTAFRMSGWRNIAGFPNFALFARSSFFIISPRTSNFKFRVVDLWQQNAFDFLVSSKNSPPPLYLKTLSRTGIILNPSEPD
jgi:hypothetical protein